MSASGRWDCGEMVIICGFCNAKMWIKERLAKLNNSNPHFSLCYKNGKVMCRVLPLVACIMTPDIGRPLLFANVAELRQRCHILRAFTDNGWHRAQHIQRCMHCNGFVYKRQ